MEYFSSASGSDELAPGWGKFPPPALTRAVDELKRGSPVILCHRGETFLVLLAAHTRAGGTAALIRHGSGIIKVAMEIERLRALGIPPMAGDIEAGRHRVYVAVDAACGVGTGISATDRATTIRGLSDAASGPETFVRPGHVLLVAASMDLGGAPTEADMALLLGWQADVYPLVAAYCALVSVEQPTAMASPREAESIAVILNLSYIDSQTLIHEYYRGAPPHVS